MKALYSFLLFLWFVLGYFLCKSFICSPDKITSNSSAVGAVSSVGDCQSALAFRLKDSDFSLISNENFTFNRSTGSILEYSSELDQMLDQVVSFINDNPDVRMQGKGMYAFKEENNTDFDNLGLARADAIQSIFEEKGIEMGQVSTLGKELKTDCFDDNVLRKGASVAFAKK